MRCGAVRYRAAPRVVLRLATHAVRMNINIGLVESEHVGMLSRDFAA